MRTKDVLFLIAVLLIGSAAPALGDGGSGSDAPGDFGNPVIVTGDFTANVSADPDIDAFRYDVYDSILAINTSSVVTNQVLEVSIYDAAFQVLDQDLSATANKSVSATVAGQGLIYILITGRTSLGQYNVTIDTAPRIIQDDHGSGADAGNTTGTAVSALLGDTVTGFASNLSDDRDSYIVASVTDHTWVEAALSITSGDLVAHLMLTMNGNTVQGASPQGNWAAISTDLDVSIEVIGGEGNYSLSFTTHYFPADDVGSGTDAGEVHSMALWIEPPVLIGGHLGEMDVDDWYAFNITNTNSTDVWVNTTSSDQIIRLRIYDSPTFSPNDEDVGPSPSLTHAYFSDTIYLRVTLEGAATNYTLSLAAMENNTPGVDTSQNDAGSLIDAGDTVAGAVAATSPAMAEMPSTDTGDYFVFSATAGMVEMVVTPPTDTVLLVAITNDGIGNMFYMYTFALVDNGLERLSFWVDGPLDLIYVNVTFVTGPGGDYEFSWVMGEQQNDAGLGGDEPGIAEAAPRITSGSYAGFLGATDIVDVYRIGVTNQNDVTINVTMGDAMFVVVEIQIDDDPTEDLLDVVDESEMGADGVARLTYTADFTGDAWVVVWNLGLDGDYTMELAIANEEVDEALTLAEGIMAAICLLVIVVAGIGGFLLKKKLRGNRPTHAQAYAAQEQQYYQQQYNQGFR